jgi:DME family drug/metabolite transporter
LGYLLIVGAAVLWGLLGPASRFAMRDGVDPLEIAFWRAALGTVLFGVHAGAIRRLRVERRDLPAVIAFGVVGIGLFYAAYFQAVRQGGAALAAVLLYTAPVWVAVLAWLLRWERMNATKAVALAITLAGVAGLASAAGGEVRVGAGALFWGLLSGWAYATYYLFGKRFFDRYPAPTLFLYALPVGALGLLPLVDFHPAKSAAAWGAIVFVALIPTYGAYLLYSAGLRRVEATRAATVATVEPVVSAVAAYLVWGERLAPAGYAFAALVLAGVMLMVRAGGARAE